MLSFVNADASLNKQTYDDSMNSESNINNNNQQQPTINVMNENELINTNQYIASIVPLRAKLLSTSSIPTSQKNASMSPTSNSNLKPSWLNRTDGDDDDNDSIMKMAKCTDSQLLSNTQTMLSIAQNINEDNNSSGIVNTIQSSVRQSEQSIAVTDADVKETVVGPSNDNTSSISISISVPSLSSSSLSLLSSVPSSLSSLIPLSLTTTNESIFSISDELAPNNNVNANLLSDSSKGGVVQEDGATHQIKTNNIDLYVPNNNENVTQQSLGTENENKTAEQATEIHDEIINSSIVNNNQKSETSFNTILNNTSNANNNAFHDQVTEPCAYEEKGIHKNNETFSSLSNSSLAQVNNTSKASNNISFGKNNTENNEMKKDNGLANDTSSTTPSSLSLSTSFSNASLRVISEAVNNASNVDNNANVINNNAEKSIQQQSSFNPHSSSPTSSSIDTARSTIPKPQLLLSSLNANIGATNAVNANTSTANLSSVSFNIRNTDYNHSIIPASPFSSIVKDHNAIIFKPIDPILTQKSNDISLSSSSSSISPTKQRNNTTLPNSFPSSIPKRRNDNLSSSSFSSSSAPPPGFKAIVTKSSYSNDIITEIMPESDDNRNEDDYEKDEYNKLSMMENDDNNIDGDDENVDEWTVEHSYAISSYPPHSSHLSSSSHQVFTNSNEDRYSNTKRSSNLAPLFKQPQKRNVMLPNKDQQLVINANENEQLMAKQNEDVVLFDGKINILSSYFFFY